MKKEYVAKFTTPVKFDEFSDWWILSQMTEDVFNASTYKKIENHFILDELPCENEYYIFNLNSSYKFNMVKTLDDLMIGSFEPHLSDRKRPYYNIKRYGLYSDISDLDENFMYPTYKSYFKKDIPVYHNIFSRADYLYKRISYEEFVLLLSFKNAYKALINYNCNKDEYLNKVSVDDYLKCKIPNAINAYYKSEEENEK